MYSSTIYVCAVPTCMHTEKKPCKQTGRDASTLKTQTTTETPAQKGRRQKQGCQHSRVAGNNRNASTKGAQTTTGTPAQEGRRKQTKGTPAQKGLTGMPAQQAKAEMPAQRGRRQQRGRQHKRDAGNNRDAGSNRDASTKWAQATTTPEHEGRR